MRATFAITLLLLLIASSLLSQTIVQPGSVCGVWDTTGNRSPYIVTGNISVAAACSLIIKPGVNVRFQAGGWELLVGTGAKLVAKGTESSPVIFESHQGQFRGSWSGIKLINTGSNDTIDNCAVRFAGTGIYVEDSAPAIRNSTLSSNRDYGLNAWFYLDSTSNFTVSNCLFYDDSIGVHARSYSDYSDTRWVRNTIVLDHCLVYGNRGVAVWSNAGSLWTVADSYARMFVRISNSTIVNNQGSGILAETPNRGRAYVQLVNSIVAYNQGYGCRNGPRGQISAGDIIYNCFWENRLGNLYGISGPIGPPLCCVNANGDSCDINFNLFCDPQFVDTLTSEYHLRRSSKCIDAGTEFVFGHNFRDPDGTLPDMGAFYLHHIPGVSLVSPAHNAATADSVRFIWMYNIPSVSRYWLDIGTDSLFGTNTIDSTVIDTTKYVRQLTAGQHWWRVKAKNALGWGAYSASRRFIVIIDDVEKENGTPSEFGVSQNYPNPFNPGTKIEVRVPSSEFVELKIFDLLGHEVATLVNERMNPGTYSASWDATGFASGMYLYRMKAGSFVETKKLLLLR